MGLTHAIALFKWGIVSPQIQTLRGAVKVHAKGAPREDTAAYESCYALLERLEARVAKLDEVYAARFSTEVSVCRHC